MSEVKVNKLSPRSGTTVTLGDSGDTFAITSGASISGFTSTGIDDNATSTAITIDSSERVGIGESSPISELHITDASATAVVRLESSDSGDCRINFDDQSATDRGRIIYAHSDDSLRTEVAGSERMRIRSNGKIGLNTSSADAELHIAPISGGTNASILLANSNKSQYFRIQNNETDDALVFNANDLNERMRIASSGNVGIGSSTPTQKLFSAVDSTLPIPTSASMGSSTSGVANGIGIHNTNNSAQYSGLTLETKTTNASRWLIANEWKSNFNGDLVFRSRIDGSSSSEILRLKSDGKVGIGTTSPSTNLDISSGGDATINLKASGQSNGLQLSQLTSDGGSSISATNNNYLKFSTNATERMRITNAGNVGIGTSSPSTNLQIEANDNLTTTFPVKITNSAGSGFTELGCYAINTSAVDLVLQAGGNEGLRIDKDNGNVGIGTSSPGTKLEVVGTGVNGIELGEQSDGNDSSRLFFTNNSNVCAIRSSGGSLKFSTGATINSSSGDDRVTINSSGNVGIGTTSTNARLSVADTKTGTEASPHLLIVGNGYSGHHWLDTSAYYIGQNSNARSLRIYSGSNEAAGAQLSAGGTSFGTYSDERLKKDITDLTNGLNKILALRPVNFKYKSDADDYRNRIGIIAQSIVGQVDEALDETKITADDETKYYNVRYQDLIPVLVKGIQEQQTQIQELEARITALEANNP